MTDAQLVRELKRRLDAQTNVIEAIYRQLMDIYARLEALQLPANPNPGKDHH